MARSIDTPENRDIVLDALALGRASSTHIARKLPLSVAQVYRLLRKMGDEGVLVQHDVVRSWWQKAAA